MTDDFIANHRVDAEDISIDRAYVLDKLGEKIKEVDVDRYIL